MMMKERPILETIQTMNDLVGPPELEQIAYDLWILSVKSKFPNIDYPVYIKFQNVIGFRVLDEGDLLEFWAESRENQNWIWSVKENGWFDLERSRKDFASGSNPDIYEFLLAGVNECINVLTADFPDIEMPKL